MPNIPEGQHKYPGGLIIITSSKTYPVIIRLVPREPEIPKEVVGFNLFWTEEEFDGSEVDFGDGYTEEELEHLPPHYRYEGEEWGTDTTYEATDEWPDRP